METQVSQYLNTHFYDGKLVQNDLISKIIDLRNSKLSETKRELFAKLAEEIKTAKVEERFRLTALQAIHIIDRDIHQPGNYDCTNGIYADDVLYLVCKRMYSDKEIEIFDYLTEQLSDIITSGQCAQGRSTRLFQLLRTLEEN